MAPAILELDPRDPPRGRAPCRSRAPRHHWRAPRRACADVHGDARQIVVTPLALARVDARAHLDPEVAAPARCHPLGAADRPCRSVERGEEPVAGRVDLLAVEVRRAPRGSTRRAASSRVAPAMVTESCGMLRRSDDVGEQHRLQHAVDVAIGVDPVTSSSMRPVVPAEHATSRGALVVRAARSASHRRCGQRHSGRPRSATTGARRGGRQPSAQ